MSQFLFSDYSGSVESVAVMPGVDEDEVWVSVLRTVNGSLRRFIERLRPRVFDAIEDGFFVDCGVLYDGVATTTVSGLDHLEGEEVAMLGDGAVFPNQTVVGGQVSFSEPVKKAAVGLPFRYKLKPMRIEPNPEWHGSPRKITELILSFLESGGVEYGTEEADLRKIEFRTTEPPGSPPALFTGDQTVTINAGFDPEDPILISGIDPLPCYLRAILVRSERTGK